MTRMLTLTTAVVAVALMTFATVSADPGDGPPDRPSAERPDGARPHGKRPDRGPRGFGPPPNPFMTALDTDKDGELSAEEIESAVTALKAMDKNNDGKLTHDEVRPRHGDRGPGGPPPGGPPPEGRGPRDPAAFIEHLMSHDKDGDDKLSEDEIPERMQRLFEFADTDDDGFLTRTELEEAAKKRQERHGSRDGRGPGRRHGPKGDRPQAPPEE